MSVRGALEERIALMAPARRLRLALADEILTRRFGSRPLRLLDAGCGDGLPALALAKRHPAWTLTGLDRRADLLEGARARARARGLANARFEPADLTQPLPVAGFDAALALECLSEIPDDAAALRSIGAALAPGGLLVAQVPERGWKPLLPGSATTWREQVRQGYDAAGLEAALRFAGLETLEIRPTYHGVTALGQELRDRIKDRGLAVRLAAFPLLAGAMRLERLGLTGGRANALLAVARRPAGAGSPQPR